MSDSVGYTPGAGALIAADDVGGVLHQRVKLTIGADGVNDGDVSGANPLPVAGAVSVTGTVPVSGPLTDAELRAAAVQTLDDAVAALLRQMLALAMSPAGFDRSLGRARVTAALESGTVTTLSTLTNVGSLPSEMIARHQNIAAWSATNRARIT